MVLTSYYLRKLYGNICDTIIWKARSTAKTLSLRFVLVVLVSINVGRDATAADSFGAEICGSFVSVRSWGYGNNYPLGWTLSGGISTDRVGIIGEVGGSYHRMVSSFGPGFDLKASLYHFMGGPAVRVQESRRVTTSAYVLFGGVRIGNNLGGYSRNFAWEPGTAVDLAVSRVVAVRLQGELLLIRSGGGTIKELRGGAGLVVHTR